MPPTRSKQNRKQGPGRTAPKAASSQPSQTAPAPATAAPRPAARRTQRPRRRSSAQWPWIVGAIAVVALIVGFFLFRQTSAVAGVQTFGGQNRDHVDTAVTYDQIPPVGGAHSPIPQKCDVYTEPVPNEKAVHSMEHGAVWITYRPDLPASEIDQLTRIARGQSYILLSPYPDLPSPVVASAWGVQLKLDSASDERLPQFIKAYRQGPQTPEPGATC